MKLLSLIVVIFNLNSFASENKGPNEICSTIIQTVGPQSTTDNHSLGMPHERSPLAVDELQPKLASKADPKGVDRALSSPKSVVVETSYRLNSEYVINVDASSFWISKVNSDKTETPFGKKVMFEPDPELSDIQLYNKKFLPNSILPSGPFKWFFSLYNSRAHQIDVYSISIENGDLELEYQFRVVLFEEGLASAPYLSFGPSIIYKGADKHLYVYLFDKFGSEDVELVYDSKKSFNGELSDPSLEKSGMLNYKIDSKNKSVRVFNDIPEWRDYVRKLEGQ